MIIDQKLMDSLSQQAKANPRLRQAFDLRTTPEDQSQRILNAVEPGTILPIHRHRGSTETIIVLRGKVVQHYYNDAGEKTASYELAPNSAQVGMSVPVGQWHALESLEEGSVIFECKDGLHGIPVPDYVDENVSTKVVKIIQSYVGIVNKMVWRKF